MKRTIGDNLVCLSDADEDQQEIASPSTSHDNTT